MRDALIDAFTVAAAGLCLAFALVWAFTDAALVESATVTAPQHERAIR